MCTNRSIKVLEYPFSLNSCENSKQIDFITKRRCNSKVVTYGSNFFVISENRRSCSLEKYSKLNENKIVLPSLLDKRTQFCVCSFMQKVYVIGGFWEVENASIESCVCYDTKRNKWTYFNITLMNQHRDNASCAVFKVKLSLQVVFYINRVYLN